MQLYDFYNSSTSALLNYVNTAHRGAQVFKAKASYKAKSLGCYVSENTGQSAGTITYGLYSVNGSYEPNTLLTSCSVADSGSNVSVVGGFLDIALSTPYTITTGNYYALVLSISANPTTPGTLDYFHFLGTNGGNPFGDANEDFIYSLDSGASWTHQNDNDGGFRIIAMDGGFFPFFW